MNLDTMKQNFDRLGFYWHLYNWLKIVVKFKTFNFVVKVEIKNNKLTDSKIDIQTLNLY